MNIIVQKFFERIKIDGKAFEDPESNYALSKNGCLSKVL